MTKVKCPTGLVPSHIENVFMGQMYSLKVILIETLRIAVKPKGLDLLEFDYW